MREIREEKAWLLRSRINPLPISGALAHKQGDLDRAEAATAEALAMARAAGKRWLIAAATHNLANNAFDRGDRKVVG